MHMYARRTFGMEGRRSRGAGGVRRRRRGCRGAPDRRGLIAGQLACVPGRAQAPGGPRGLKCERCRPWQAAVRTWRGAWHGMALRAAKRCERARRPWHGTARTCPASRCNPLHRQRGPQRQRVQVAGGQASAERWPEVQPAGQPAHLHAVVHAVGAATPGEECGCCGLLMFNRHSPDPKHCRHALKSIAASRARVHLPTAHGMRPKPRAPWVTWSLGPQQAQHHSHSYDILLTELNTTPCWGVTALVPVNPAVFAALLLAGATAAMVAYHRLGLGK